MIIKFIIGDSGPYTPLDGTTKCVIPDTQLRNFRVYKNGFGEFFEGVHFSKWYQGGIILLGELEFVDNEQYVIDIAEEITVTPCCN